MPTITALPTYISLHEAAVRYGVSESVLRRAVSDGTVRAVQLTGRKMAVADEDVAVIESQQYPGLSLPTYIPLRKAAAHYGVSETMLRRAVSDGIIHAVRLAKGKILVAGKDVNLIADDLKAKGEKPSTYIPISEAYSLYGINEETLRKAVASGMVRAVQTPSGNMLVASKDVVSIANIRIDESLRGKPIRVTEAARLYGVSHANLSRWADAGLIRVLERKKRLLLLDEADAKLAADIFHMAKHRTGSFVKAGHILKHTLPLIKVA